MKRRDLLAGTAATLAMPALAQSKPDKLIYVGDNGPWHWTLVEEVGPAFENALYEAQVGGVDGCRHERTDHLRVAAAHELASAARDKRAQRVQPRRIDRRGGLERIRSGLNANRRPGSLCQPQERPVAAPHNLGALRLLDRGIGEVQVED